VSRTIRLLLFLCGSTVFAYLVTRIGTEQLLADAGRTGWMFLPILFLCGIVYVCNAAAWQLVMTDEARRPPFWRTFAITVSGFSLNFVTPMVNIGGEPFKVAAVSSWLGMRRAAGSVVLYQMLHTLGMLLSFLTAIVLGVFLLPHDPVVLGALAIAFAAVSWLTLLLMTGHRRGVLEGALNALHRVPLLRGLGRRLEPLRATLALMDAQITQFYHRDRRRFFQALVLEYVSRCIFMVEYVLIPMSVGVDVGYATAFAIGGLNQLIQNVVFIVPFELGTKEVSLYLLFQLLGLAPALGVYTAIVSRLRDLAWIAVGLALVWLSGRRAAPAGATAP
jgi:uncharacterized protein (TIRG00374 family)